MKDLNRRSFLKYGGLSALFGGLAMLGLKPEKKDYDPSREAKPNAIQLEILRRIAQQYDFVCLGDTGHGKAEIQQFARHPELVAAMASCGKTHYFMEIDPSENRLLSPEIEEQEFMVQCQENLVGVWMPPGEARENVCKTFSESIGTGQMEFHAVDQRYKEGHFAYDGFTTAQKMLRYPVAKAHALQRFLFGHQDLTPTIKVLGLPFAFSVRPERNPFIDDRNTLEAIKEISDNGVILYGAAHFDPAVSDNPHALIRLLHEDDISSCAVNIYKSPEDITPNTFDSMVDLVVFPDKENPAGVYIYNESILEKLELDNGRSNFLRPRKWVSREVSSGPTVS